MRAILSSLLFFSLCSLQLHACEPASSTRLEPYRAVYQAKFNGMPITAQRELLKVDQGYRLQTSASNFLGKIRESEDFHLDQQGRIRIDGYVSKRSLLGSKRKEALSIDHDLNKAIFTTRKNKQRETPMLAEYLGPITYQLQLRRDLAIPGAELRYKVIAHGKVKHYQFERMGEERLNTGLGEIEAMKVRRVREEKDRETIFWMARDLAFLPIKIWQREGDGETYEMTLQSATINDEALKATTKSTNEKTLNTSAAGL